MDINLIIVDYFLIMYLMGIFRKLRESRKNMLKEEMTLLKTEASNIRDARQKDGSLDSVKS